jgi:hypothetical protein
MIRFSLRCKAGHEFEAWFRSGAAFEEGGGVGCPVCGSRKVEKAPMAPAIGGRSAETDKPPEKVTLAAAPDPRMTAVREALKELRRHVIENAEHVGDRFAEEARKMHYDEVEPRAIYGEATSEEARALIEEGIELQPLPSLPDDNN